MGVYLHRNGISGTDWVELGGTWHSVRSALGVVDDSAMHLRNEVAIDCICVREYPIRQ